MLCFWYVYIMCSLCDNSKLIYFLSWWWYEGLKMTRARKYLVFYCREGHVGQQWEYCDSLIFSEHEQSFPMIYNLFGASEYYIWFWMVRYVVFLHSRVTFCSNVLSKYVTNEFQYTSIMLNHPKVMFSLTVQFLEIEKMLVSAYTNKYRFTRAENYSHTLRHLHYGIYAGHFVGGATIERCKTMHL